MVRLDGREDVGAVMPFHALFLALATPPLAAILLLLMFGASPVDGSLVLAGLPPAYFIGFAPAFLAGRFDRSLARRGWRAVARLSVAAGIAGSTGMAILADLYLTGRLHGTMPLLVPVALALAFFLALGTALFLAQLIARARRSR